MNETRSLAFELFKKEKSLEEVAKETGRARATVLEYLTDYLERESSARVNAYIPESNFEKIKNAIESVGMERLKPIYLYLNETISYEDIRIAVAYLKGKEKIIA